MSSFDFRALTREAAKKIYIKGSDIKASPLEIKKQNKKNGNHSTPSPAIKKITFLFLRLPLGKKQEDYTFGIIKLTCLGSPEELFTK